MLHILFSIFLLNLLRPVFPAAVPSTNRLAKRQPEAVFGRGLLAYEAAGTPLVALDNGMEFYFQNSDSNSVVYVNGVAKWYNGVHEAATCDNGNNCFMAFQQDGNWVTYYNGVATWQSGTVGKGEYLAFWDKDPYIVIYDINWNIVWTSSGGSPPAPQPKGVYNLCDQNGLTHINDAECVGPDPAVNNWWQIGFYDPTDPSAGY